MKLRIRYMEGYHNRSYLIHTTIRRIAYFFANIEFPLKSGNNEKICLEQSKII